MDLDQCRKVNRIGRDMAICHKPLGHQPEMVNNPPPLDRSGHIVVVHEAVLNGKKVTWEDDA